jgi:hypothetical protein
VTVALWERVIVNLCIRKFVNWCVWKLECDNLPIDDQELKITPNRGITMNNPVRSAGH